MLRRAPSTWLGAVKNLSLRGSAPKWQSSTPLRSVPEQYWGEPLVASLSLLRNTAGEFRPSFIRLFNALKTSNAHGRAGVAIAAVPFGSLTLSMGPLSSYVSRPVGSGYALPLRREPSDGSPFLLLHNYENRLLRWLNIAAWAFFGGGLVAALNYAVVGSFACCTIVGIPYGLQMLRLGWFCVQPFGKEIYEIRAGHTTAQRVTTIAFAPFSITLAGVHLLAAGLNACSIIGLSFAEEHLRLAAIVMEPLTKEVGLYRGGDMLFESVSSARERASRVLKMA